MTLPAYVLEHLMAFVPRESLIVLACVGRRWNGAAQDHFRRALSPTQRQDLVTLWRLGPTLISVSGRSLLRRGFISCFMASFPLRPSRYKSRMTDITLLLGLSAAVGDAEALDWVARERWAKDPDPIRGRLRVVEAFVDSVALRSNLAFVQWYARRHRLTVAEVHGHRSELYWRTVGALDPAIRANDPAVPAWIRAAYGPPTPRAELVGWDQERK
jgi:hypothetical protein